MPVRLRLEIRGAVQGVGFRPFVYRLATEDGLAGWVVNDVGGVVVEVEGERAALERFRGRLTAESPRPARIEELDEHWLAPVGHSGFRIERSGTAGAPTVQMLPDIAVCEACLAEVRDPADRRHRYPFTNCTHCGPRFSILRSLPYDRQRTTMARFTMCADCRREYEDPADRRFHAQPDACPVCGPQLALWDAEGNPLAEREAALEAAVRGLRDGRIVAVKGLGGFHLMVDATDGEALARLRERKPRREKPLALMVRDLVAAGRLCRLDAVARERLGAPEAPILLLPRLPGAAVHEEVAPGNPCLGVMLPYTPLHHLILDAVDFPVVATSGNLSDEPICTDESEAGRRLAGIADLYLVHDRPIARHVDDSVMWVIDGSARMLRRARGYAPRPVRVDRELPVVLAVGAHLKNAVALSIDRQVFVSQHVGDMETAEAFAAFERVVADFLELYDARPVAVAHDLHPDYATTRWAIDPEPGRVASGRIAGLPRIAVQHHHAHLAACLLDNRVAGPALGVTWDGTGYGTDDTVWGGEFLVGDAAGFRRIAALRPFRLPGGEAAVREPRRTAVALLRQCIGPHVLDRDDLPPVRAFRDDERRVLARMLERDIRSPLTTSAGRLFDGVAALLGLQPTTTFEGQAAMALEALADPAERGVYAVVVEPRPEERSTADAPRLELDWRPLLGELLEDRGRGTSRAIVSARFHNTLAEAIRRIALEAGEPRVALSGGCFQNRLLTQRCIEGLRGAGFEVLLHERVPPNDGGICLGQIAVAAASLMGRSTDAAGV